MLKSCNKLAEGIIDNTCNYQVNAISGADAIALLKAHLRQDHNEEFVSLTGDDLTTLENQITNEFS